MKGIPQIEPSSTPAGVQGREEHSVDQAATAALKSLVRSTLKAPSYVDAEKLSDSARSTAFKRSLPAVRAHLLQTATGSSVVKGRRSVIEDRARQERASASNSGLYGFAVCSTAAASGLVGRRRLRILPAFGLLEANLARPSRILSLMLRR